MTRPWRLVTDRLKSLRLFRPKPYHSTQASVKRVRDTIVKRYGTGRGDILQYNNEVFFNKLLAESGICPMILDNCDRERKIVFQYCGEPLSVDNAPNTWKEQLSRILDVLEGQQVYHNDCHLNNFLVHGDKIYIIDFAWSSLVRPGFPALNTLNRSKLAEATSITEAISAYPPSPHFRHDHNTPPQ